MTLDQLRIFLTVADEIHMTRAAQKLGMTQSAVSAAISALEKQHDIRLFDRIGRGIQLTEAGHTLIPAARGLLAQADTTSLLLSDLSSRPQGALRVYASQTVAIYFLPVFLVQLHQDLRQVRITLNVGNTTSVAQAVFEGAADLGFVEGEVQEGSLRRKVVARDELVIVMSRDHPKATAPLSSADYRSFEWLLREPGSGTRAEFETHLAMVGMGLGDIGVALEIPSNEAVLSAVAVGNCVSMLSRRAVEPLLAAGNLVLREVTWAPRPERPFSVLSHPARHRTRASQALLDLIENRS